MIRVRRMVDVGQLAAAVGVSCGVADRATHRPDGSPVRSRDVVAVQVARGDWATGAVDQTAGAPVPGDRPAAVAAGEWRQ